VQGELKTLREQFSGMKEQWEKEKTDITRVQKLREEIEQMNADIEKAQREYDLNRAAELQYGRLPQLKAELTEAPALAVELPDGRIITGRTSDLMGPSAAVVLNALKALAGISDDVKLISPKVIEPIQSLKCDYLGNHNPRLHSDEVLVALSICAATSEKAALAMAQLPRLAGCEAHSTVILSQVDDNIFRRLKVNLTCDARYQTHKLYHK
jgi:uncharacterized protein (UPF0371 family)